MPETRLAKARETLPAGYQFGDSAPWAASVRFIQREQARKWRDLMDAYAATYFEQFSHYTSPFAPWNTIEPE